MLVRDATLGAFALRYMPNYGIVAIHGSNRIVVRDERGNERLRRASHLKACDLKEKVTSMTPEQEEYSRFGRSTKLLLHPKDIPDLKFASKLNNGVEIPQNMEISMIELNITPGKDKNGEILPNESVECLDLPEEWSEISPKAKKYRGNQMINVNKQCIVGFVEKCWKQGEILANTSSNGQLAGMGDSSTWFNSPMNCVSKWSKALKQGVTSTMGLKYTHTASTPTGGNEELGFSFLL